MSTTDLVLPKEAAAYLDRSKQHFPDLFTLDIYVNNELHKQQALVVIKRAKKRYEIAGLLSQLPESLSSPVKEQMAYVDGRYVVYLRAAQATAADDPTLPDGKYHSDAPVRTKRRFPPPVRAWAFNMSPC